MFDTDHEQTNTNNVKHEPYYKQLEVMTNQTSCLCGNRSGYHNKKHITGVMACLV